MVSPDRVGVIMSINGDNNGVVTDVVGQDVSVVFSDELVDMLASSSARLGVNILNDDVMMSQLMKQVTERAMQAEMDEHLGYSKNEARGRGTGNSRNGTSSKTVTSKYGQVRLDQPRNRAGTFTSVIVSSYQRRMDGFDDVVISLYAEGDECARD